jgi:hypothetical protein
MCPLETLEIVHDDRPTMLNMSNYALSSRHDPDSEVLGLLRLCSGLLVVSII